VLFAALLTVAAVAPVAWATPPPCTVTNAAIAHTVYQTLEEAVVAAKAGQTLKLEGTCFGTTTIGKGLTIDGVASASTGTPTLNGEHKGSVLTIATAVPVKLLDLTVTDGESEKGAGIFNSGALTLEGVTVEENTATAPDLDEAGAGIYDQRGTLSVSKSTFTGDDTTNKARGGAIMSSHGRVTVSASKLNDNNAGYGPAIDGTFSVVSFVSSEMEDNEASEAGPAIDGPDFGTLTVSGTKILKNKGPYPIDVTNTNVTLTSTLVEENIGGGVYASGGKLAISSSDINDNETEAYAGIYMSDGEVSLVNSTVSHDTATVAGGGVYVDVGGLRVSGSTFESDKAPAGGAIYGKEAALAVSSSKLSKDSSSEDGGAIYSDMGTLEVSKSTLLSDSTSGPESEGGAIYSSGGELELEAVTIKGGSAVEAGGDVASLAGSTVINASTLSEGTAALGGVIHNAGGLLTLTSSKVELGRGKKGGGIFTASAEEPAAVYLSKSSVSKNHAVTYGGGIDLVSGALEVNDSSIASNVAEGEGGGIFNLAGTLTLTDALFSANTPDNCTGAGCP
jgi:hypothetical protein